jgi:hypothetical protein
MNKQNIVLECKFSLFYEYSQLDWEHFIPLEFYKENALEKNLEKNQEMKKSDNLNK